MGFVDMELKRQMTSCLFIIQWQVASARVVKVGWGHTAMKMFVYVIHRSTWDSHRHVFSPFGTDLLTSMYPSGNANYCDFHCRISDSLIRLSLFTLGLSPVAMPFANSTNPPI